MKYVIASLVLCFVSSINALHQTYLPPHEQSQNIISTAHGQLADSASVPGHHVQHAQSHHTPAHIATLNQEYLPPVQGASSPIQHSDAHHSHGHHAQGHHAHVHHSSPQVHHAHAQVHHAPVHAHHHHAPAQNQHAFAAQQVQANHAGSHPTGSHHAHEHHSQIHHRHSVPQAPTQIQNAAAPVQHAQVHHVVAHHAGVHHAHHSQVATQVPAQDYLPPTPNHVQDAHILDIFTTSSATGIRENDGYHYRNFRRY